VIPTKDNPRKIRKDDPAFKEFCANVKALGVLEPVLVRPHPREKGKYDLRAGARRHAAAIEAGFKDIPAIVKELDDKQALEITVCENLHREDLTPLEEAKGIQSLLDAKWEVKAIAANLGKSPSWVLRRAALNSLAPEWCKALESQEYLGWSAAHAELIARLPADVQLRLLEDNSLKWCGTLRELENRLANITRELKRAPWGIDDATLDPKAGACSACQKRSSCKPGLFDDDGVSDAKVKTDDRCLDDACWNSKARAHLARTRDRLAKEHGLVQLVTEYYGKSDLGHTLPAYNVERCKKTDKGAVCCLMVDGKAPGNVFWAKPKSDSSTGGGRKARPLGADGRPKPLPLAKRREELNLRREVLVNDKLYDVVINIEWDKSGLSEDQLWRLLATFGTEDRYADTRSFCGSDNGTGEDWARFAGMQRDHAVAEAWRQVRGVLVSRMNFCPPEENILTNEHEAIAKLLKIDLAKLRVEAAKEIPEPRSWANLKADGTPKTEASAKLKVEKKPAAKKPAEKK